MDFQESQSNFISYKMDILFYNSIKKAGKFYFLSSIYHSVKALIFIIFFPIYILVLGTTKELIVIFMGLAIGISILNSLISFAVYNSVYRETEENNIYFLNLAAANEHALMDEPINPKDYQKLQKLVSTEMYNAYNSTTLDSDGLTEKIKREYESEMSSDIQDTVMDQRRHMKYLGPFSKFLDISLLIFGIVALVVSQPSVTQIVVIAVYLVLECVHIIKILGFILLIVFFPFVCIGCTIYQKCCDPENYQLKLPKEQSATCKLIMEGDGSCCICLQEIKKDEEIIILPCSRKHMFHALCINSWVQFHPNCPICRHRLA